jgi:HK97 family phage portal protein
VAEAPVAATPQADHAPVPLPEIVRGSSIGSELFGSFGGLPAVNEQSARTVTAISACVNLIAGAISALPLNVYTRQANGDRERAHDDALWWLLNEEMTPRWAAAAGWVFLMESRLLHGDGFARIWRDPNGGIRGLEPIHPLRVTVAPYPDGSRLAYAIEPDPTIPAPYQGQKRIVLDQDDVIHFTGPGFNGVRSLSPLRYSLRMAGSVALATQDYSAQFFANSARPDYVLQTEAKLSPERIEQLRGQVDEQVKAAAGKAHRPMVLDGGMKAQTIGLPLQDLQLIETRMFQIEEIARAYGIPPHMIGHTDKNTSWGSGVEAMGVTFVRYTLGSLLASIHNELNRKLFRTARKVLEFDTFELERADMKSMFTAFRLALGRSGEEPILTADEIRSYLNRAPRGAATGVTGNEPQPSRKPARQ